MESVPMAAVAFKASMVPGVQKVSGCKVASLGRVWNHFFMQKNLL